MLRHATKCRKHLVVIGHQLRAKACRHHKGGCHARSHPLSWQSDQRATSPQHITPALCEAVTRFEALLEKTRQAAIDAQQSDHLSLLPGLEKRQACANPHTAIAATSSGQEAVEVGMQQKEKTA
eukprot:1139496-Pelagomonas_calceolata.AAC.4